MALDILSTADAKGNLRNPNARWPDARRKQNRMGLYATCSSKPSFSFTKDDLIFTSGSCFARNIEHRLHRYGFSLAVPDDPILRKGLINKYVTSSIVNELKWSLSLAPFPVDTLIEIQPGLFHDPHLHPSAQGLVDYDAVLARRAEIDCIGQRVRQCTVFIATLGLAETWIDVKAGCVLNGSPPASALGAEPERFAFMRQSFDDVLNDLEELHAILRDHGRPDLRFVITVSPVPFKATYTGQDAIVANTYSKSVLRVAAEQFANTHDNVDYFPSYEMVTLSDRSAAFLPDNIHVQSGMVDRVMDSFLRSYAPTVELLPLIEERLPEVGTTPEEIYAAARKISAEGNHMLAARLLQKLESSFEFEQLSITPTAFYFELAGELAETYRSFSPIVATVKYYLGLALKADPGHAHLWTSAAAILERIGLVGDAAEYRQRAEQIDGPPVLSFRGRD